MKKQVVERLSEPSTYAGLAVIAATFGITDEAWAIYSQGLAGVFAIAAMLMGEKGKPAE